MTAAGFYGGRLNQRPSTGAARPFHIGRRGSKFDPDLSSQPPHWRHHCTVIAEAPLKPLFVHAEEICLKVADVLK